MFEGASVRENRCTLFFVIWSLATFACANTTTHEQSE